MFGITRNNTTVDFAYVVGTPDGEPFFEAVGDFDAKSFNKNSNITIDIYEGPSENVSSAQYEVAVWGDIILNDCNGVIGTYDLELRLGLFGFENYK